MDEYIKQRVQQAEAKDEVERVKIDERLEKIISNMFDRCFKDGDFRPALGIALESRRIDKLREAIKLSPEPAGMLAYAYKVCLTLITSREFRQVVLGILVELHLQQADPDYISVVQCLVFLDDSARVADVIGKLLGVIWYSVPPCRFCTAHLMRRRFARWSPSKSALTWLRMPHNSSAPTCGTPCRLHPPPRPLCPVARRWRWTAELTLTSPSGSLSSRASSRARSPSGSSWSSCTATTTPT